MLRKMCSYYKHSEDMIRIVNVRLPFDTTCDGCIACVTFFLHETTLLLVSLFYGKCYVTKFIRELLRSPIAIGENFFLNEMRRNCLESFFFHRKCRFLFSFSFVSQIDCFFFERFFPLHFIFFLVVNDLTDFVGFAIYFFFIVMKRHNRFF